MSSAKCQKTLGFFGFSKTVTHRGQEVKVDIPDDSPDISRKVSCPKCKKRFVNNQGLGVHKLSCCKNFSSAQTSNAKVIDTRVYTSEVSNNENIARSVVNYLVGMVESGNTVESTPAKTKATRGSYVRKAHTAVFKAKVIHQIQTVVSQDEIGRQYGRSQSLVSNWLWSKARAIQREQTGDDAAVVRQHVITTFLRRYNVRMRARQRNRNTPKEAYRDDLMKWHSVTRERLVRTGANGDSYDNKWGRFLPSQRFNVDQSPMPFVVDCKKTYEIINPDDKYQKTWIGQPASGLEKRQCTLQVCTRADGKQPRIAIIFRGKVKRVRPDEEAAWHPDVDVLWQENAWADTQCSVNWVNSTLKSSVQDLDRHVLFVDNLTAQQTDDFMKSISDLKGVVWYGLKNATDLWQVVDAGIAQTLKVLAGHNYQKWLDEGDTVNDRLSAAALIKVFRFLGAALIRLRRLFYRLKIVKNTLRLFLLQEISCDKKSSLKLHIIRIY